MNINEESFVSEVKLLASKEGTYTVYVFQEISSNKLIMCTKLPNWNIPSIPIGAKGFLEYKIVKAGELYYNPTEDRHNKYKYSNIYFHNFVLKTDIVENNNIIL